MWRDESGEKVWGPVFEHLHVEVGVVGDSEAIPICVEVSLN